MTNQDSSREGALPIDVPLDSDAWGQAPSGARSSDAFAHARDGFDRLWAPHRMAYLAERKVRNEQRRAEGLPVGDEQDCPFCAGPQVDPSDEECLVVAKSELCYVVLNLFPYNPGHMLICPYRHVGQYLDLTREELADMADLTQTAIRVTQVAARPHGFNMGINQGDIAGTSVPTHVHQHLVPRWGGDANFMPIIAQTKPLPETLNATRARLVAAWAQVDPDRAAL